MDVSLSDKQAPENSKVDDMQERCPSCNSTNVEIYIKDEIMILVCLDCDRKALLD